MTKQSWRVAEGTLTGPHHRKKNTPNQDAFGSLEQDGLLVIVAADGAGSLELSHIGSQLAVDVVLREAFISSRERGLDLLVEQAMETARQTLMNHPDRSQIGCTLAVAALTADEWAIGVVGDAFAIVHDDANSFRLFENPPVGEYANLTQLITSNDCDVLIEYGSGNILGAAVSTDGLEHAALKNGEAFQGFWKPIFGWAAAETLDVDALLGHMDEQAKIDDDTTVVVAARKNG